MKKSLINLLSFYIIYIANFFLPLLTLPLLSRALKPNSFGQLMVSLALLGWIALVVEYGFSLSATKSISEFKNNSFERSKIIAGVFGSQIILSFGIFILILLIFIIPYDVFVNRNLLIVIFLCGIAQGCIPFWYFSGIESMIKISLTFFTLKIISTIITIIFVTSPEKAWLVLVFNLIVSLMVSTYFISQIFKAEKLPKINFNDSIKILNTGKQMFLFRLISSFYTSFNIPMLSLIVPSQEVAFYSGAERLMRVPLGIMDPISRVFYPKISHYFSEKSPAGEKLFKYSLILNSLLGCFFSLVVFLFAPFFVTIILGETFSKSQEILRILSLNILFISISNILGTQWMILKNLDRAFNSIIVVGAITNVSLSIYLSKTLGSTGAAISVTISEFLVVFLMALSISKQGDNGKKI